MIRYAALKSLDVSCQPISPQQKLLSKKSFFSFFIFIFFEAENFEPFDYGLLVEHSNVLWLCTIIDIDTGVSSVSHPRKLLIPGVLHMYKLLLYFKVLGGTFLNNCPYLDQKLMADKNLELYFSPISLLLQFKHICHSNFVIKRNHKFLTSIDSGSTHTISKIFYRLDE